MYGCGESFGPVATGYAGFKTFANDPDKDSVPQRGPLPKGQYRVILRQHPRFAPPAFFLEPQSGNRMHGRSGFWIHGDNASGDRSASTGCIVLSRGAREIVRTLADFDDFLEVVA